MDFRVVDISEGGVLVETRLGLPPATVCELRIAAAGANFKLRAEVRRCRAQLTKTDDGCKVAYRSGLEFVDLDAEAAGRVQEIIADACGMAQAGGEAVAQTHGTVVSGSLYPV